MRRQRILITFAALLVGLVVLQDPAAADPAGPAVSHDAGPAAEGEATTTTTVVVEETSPRPTPTDDESGRATWIAFGMVIGAAAIGGLLVLSNR